MSAEDILDNWFGGQAVNKLENPRELLKDLPPVSLNGRKDYGISVEIGNRKGTKLELKYPAWGYFPRHELQELLIMIKINAVKQLLAAYEQRNSKADIAEAFRIPQAQLEQNKKISNSMADFFKGQVV